LLTDLLLQKLKETADETGIESRIVNVSSRGVQLVPKGGIQWDKLNEKTRFITCSIFARGWNLVSVSIVLCESIEKVWYLHDILLDFL
jgi:hypothetical protein